MWLGSQCCTRPAIAARFWLGRPELQLWLLKALPRSNWMVSDGTDDGTPTRIVLRRPAFVTFQRKRVLMLQCTLSKANNCRLDFSVSRTVSSLPDLAETPLHKSFARAIDDRVGIVGQDISKLNSRGAWRPTRGIGSSEPTSCSYRATGCQADGLSQETLWKPATWHDLKKPLPKDWQADVGESRHSI